MVDQKIGAAGNEEDTRRPVVFGECPAGQQLPGSGVPHPQTKIVQQSRTQIPIVAECNLINPPAPGLRGEGQQPFARGGVPEIKPAAPSAGQEPRALRPERHRRHAPNWAGRSSRGDYRVDRWQLPRHDLAPLAAGYDEGAGRV